MKRLVLSLAFLALSLGLSRSVGPAGAVATPGPPGIAGPFRCVKDELSVDGVADEQEVLFEEVGFICQPE